MEMTSGQLFFEKQLAYIKARDVDGLIDNHYTEDAVLLSLGSHPIAVKGRQALKEHFRKYFDNIKPELKSLDKFIESENSILVELTMTSTLGEARAYDAFALQNGKISHHFVGILEQLDSQK